MKVLFIQFNYTIISLLINLFINTNKTSLSLLLKKNDLLLSIEQFKRYIERRFAC